LLGCASRQCVRAFPSTRTNVGGRLGCQQGGTAVSEDDRAGRVGDVSELVWIHDHRVGFSNRTECLLDVILRTVLSAPLDVGVRPLVQATFSWYRQSAAETGIRSSGTPHR